MRRPFACPICAGRGMVPADFYTQFGVGADTTAALCLACGGSGVLWGDDQRVRIDAEEEDAE